MSLDAIKTISDAEDKARLAILAARRDAALAIEQVEKEGQETVSATVARAKNEIAHLMRASDAKAAEDAKELVSNTANRRAALRARAESRLDKAAEVILERIVKG